MGALSLSGVLWVLSVCAVYCGCSQFEWCTVGALSLSGVLWVLSV